MTAREVQRFREVQRALQESRDAAREAAHRIREDDDADGAGQEGDDD